MSSTLVSAATARISFNWQLALVGLQLRILNGVVSLLTTRVENKALTVVYTHTFDNRFAQFALRLTARLVAGV